MGYLADLCGVEETPAELRKDFHCRLMDRIYRGQRHIYDLTRKYYLLGRDTLLQRMAPQGEARVLEVGCGTARNLIRLARLYPQARLYGLDASREMLKSADLQIGRQGMQDRIVLRHALAEELHHYGTFGCPEPFDAIFFSYTLSMIPNWQAAVEAALASLRTGGILWVVDFWDQAGLPSWFARLLTWWLAQFHVQHRPQLLHYFGRLHQQDRIWLTLNPLHQRYAYLARLEKIKLIEPTLFTSPSSHLVNQARIPPFIGQSSSPHAGEGGERKEGRRSMMACIAGGRPSASMENLPPKIHVACLCSNSNEQAACHRS